MLLKTQLVQCSIGIKDNRQRSEWRRIFAVQIDNPADCRVNIQIIPSGTDVVGDNKGAEAAMSALEMVSLLGKLG